MPSSNDNSINYLIKWGLVVFVVNFLISYYQEHKKIKLERIQFESTLIINAIDKSDIESSKKNIKFLIESGLISSKNEKILLILTDTTFLIKLPTTDTITIEPTIPIFMGSSNLKSIYSGQVVDRQGNPLEGVEIISNTIPGCEDSFFSKTISDKNGLFKVIIPVNNPYTILIRKEGYRDANGIYRNSDLLLPKRVILQKK